jgi:transaldolase
MKVFIDSANVQEIADALARGFATGVTTNPTLISKEERGDFSTRIREIVALLRKDGRELPLSVEVFSPNPSEMVRQAVSFVSSFDYAHLNVKVPIGWDELAVIHELKQRGIKVNCTCCMSFSQAMLAARAGADYVSLFWGRIRDGGADPMTVVRSVRTAFTENQVASEIIVGSIRKVDDITDAVLAGGHIVTIPPKFFPEMVSHPKTDEVVQQFLADFATWSR